MVIYLFYIAVCIRRHGNLFGLDLTCYILHCYRFFWNLKNLWQNHKPIIGWGAFNAMFLLSKVVVEKMNNHFPLFFFVFFVSGNDCFIFAISFPTQTKTEHRELYVFLEVCLYLTTCEAEAAPPSSPRYIIYHDLHIIYKSGYAPIITLNSL